MLVASVALISASQSVHAARGFVDGIDVSHWQGTINWNSVRSSGIQFAFAKATDGTNYVDTKFHQNMAGALAAGMYIGPYHYARPSSYNTNPLDAANEANDFVDAIASYYQQAPDLMLRPVIDVEELPEVGGTSAERAFLSQWIRNFAGVVEQRLGFEPLIYANSNYAKNYFESNLSQYDLWLANWSYTPPSVPPASATGIFDSWEVWQYSSTGTVPGISGNVDRDVFRGTTSDMLASLLAIQPPDADFNADGEIDGADFLAWQHGFGGSGSLADGDADHDGNITGADLDMWQLHYGVAASQVAVTAVPEPVGAAWLVLAAGSWLALRRGRRSAAAR